MTPRPDPVMQLAKYLAQQGFAGNTPLNDNRKNWRVIKRLTKGDAFYTFGIEAIRMAAKRRQIKPRQIRDIMVAASGSDLKRFRRKGDGYIDPYKSAVAMEAAMRKMRQYAAARKRIIFATGHPGSMVGFMMPLASWCAKLGAKVVTIPHSVQVDGRYHLDMIGPVFVASDDCSAGHTHQRFYMDALLSTQTADLVVADHGFAGSALNHGIQTIGFYDSDDPALPVAAYLGLPILAVPINDNVYNADGKIVAEVLIKNFGK